jgi:hypothetical protein
MSRRPTQPQASQATAGEAEKPANVTTVQFVLGSWPPAPRPKGPSKLNHKKSRKGCRRCKTRRVKVTSPISFIFILIGFRGSLSGNFSFSQFWEIINSGIVSSVPHLCFHKYCQCWHLQLTDVFMVNSVMKSIRLAETAGGTKRPASTTTTGPSYKSKIENPINPEAISADQIRILASFRLTQMFPTSQNPEAGVYSSLNCYTTTTPEQARLC